MSMNVSLYLRHKGSHCTYLGCLQLLRGFVYISQDLIFEVPSRDCIKGKAGFELHSESFSHIQNYLVLIKVICSCGICLIYLLEMGCFVPFGRSLGCERDLGGGAGLWLTSSRLAQGRPA